MYDCRGGAPGDEARGPLDQHKHTSNPDSVTRENIGCKTIERVTAWKSTRRHCTAVLTHSEACARLQAMGFEHTDRVPATGTGRIPARGKGPGNTGAAVSWTSDGQALHWYEFTTGDHGTIFADAVQAISSAESAKLFRQAEEKRRKAEADRLVLQDRVARQAQDRYRAGVITGTHRYITIKQLSCLHNARIDAGTGALIVPMWFSGIGLVNLQAIYPDGRKRFMTGGRVKGAYSVIGSLDGAKRVLVCEGWATGATLFELYGLPVVVAFNAGNLMPVCQALRERFENLAIVVAGDDDRQTPGNPGRTKAIEAAEAIGATLLFPELCKACKCTDHNDAMICRGRCARG